MQKQFAIHEGTKLKFKAEAFNLTNTLIFNGLNTNNPNLPLRHQADIPIN
jgi:hypothetical protein